MVVIEDISGKPGMKVTQVSYLEYATLHCEAPPVSNMLSFSTAGKPLP
jgi:hypothetical protein